ncbi:YncE family protein [Pseudochryseolinea flava]|uniref:SMP-30/Gluconolactonase/LRE-like region domain-containing protein n=1 Tax=Pseudochryseolinea flava TaxID=2059302 RepID=A0A364Y0J5_9BACT|nr:DUF5074 domain-containing protein [Pseudochryseolinea flava]RAV99792.1 hypothetical protein DQQ10_17260 [Pseudochryseolinea flava]
MNFKKFRSTILFLSLIAGAVAFQSCESDDEKEVNFESGVLIVNEGKFQAGTGTVDFYNPNTGESVLNIFKNDEGFAGDVLQSITFYNDRAFLVLNGDNKIEVANSKDFKSITAYSAPILDKPRYVQIVGEKAYVSVWGPYSETWSLDNSVVLVLNANTMAPLDTIYTYDGTENLLYDGKYLFASNNKFGNSSIVLVIDPTDNSVKHELELSAGPEGLVIDKNNKLWVITTGTYGATSGKLFRVNATTFEIEEEITIEGQPSGDLATNAAKDEILYRVGKNIYKIAIGATSAPAEAFINASDVTKPYALNVDPKTGDIYVGDANDNASPGEVFIYKADGTFKTSFVSGISPGQFIFR